MSKKITIIVEGTTASGKSFIKHQIAKHLSSLGLQVSADEHELNMKGVMDRRDHPNSFVEALANTQIEVVEKQLNRCAISKGI
jgi:hypothetical protein